MTASTAIADRFKPEMTEAQKECRLLRHAWPRRFSQDPKPRWLVTARDRRKRPIAAERYMNCIGQCGLIRTDYFTIDPVNGRMSKAADPYYDYTDKSYLLKAKDEAGEKFEPVDRDQVMFTLVMDLHPDLQW